ncbi:putative Zinc finger, RING/FYVE/PHD-type, CRA domain, CTLH/CRA to LisH motif domain, Fyv10 family [Septoria linicola]|nr:putative Zinc finger, RING/FYVE/PHD-type, CRA domain, CTLH/CRA to LisH motif domain, Fyv10 family [Septoria linicola]
MEGILAAHEQQEKKGNLSKAIDDVQKLIDLLQNTRDAVAENPDKAVLHLAKLSNPVKQSFTKVEEDLKEVNRGINQYSKALKDKFKSASLPAASNDALASQPDLINRAIAMHLLREGKFDVAKTFVREVKEHPPAHADPGVGISNAAGMNWIEDLADADEMMQDSTEGKSDAEVERSGLQQKFSDMYHILDALRNQHNLEPAIDWAHQHSHELEHRGSNLEFELSRLKFVELYHSRSDDMTDDEPDYLAGPIRALEYARNVFPMFGERYSRETSSLSASLAFSPNLQDSPYNALFHNQSAFEEASASFTREFCGMLGLSSQSPLYTAVTAGGIALPVLEKFERVIAQARGQWTSVNELPVETPLPPGFAFHSIFVCPVSKDQATDANPPMMLACGHVLAKESLDMHSKGKSRMKCPYCPQECHPRDAKRVYI